MKKHAAITMALLVVTAVAHLALQTAQARGARATPVQTVLEVPATIGGFTQMGADIDAGDRVRELLQTSTILTRNYISSRGWPVQLTIVYAGATRGSLHFPEVCLVGQGWEVRDQYSAPVGFQFAGKRLVLLKGDQKEAVLYWFKTGQYLTGSYFLNSWYWVRGKIAFRAPSSAMIRLSTTIGNHREEAVFQLLEDFAIQLVPILMEKVP